MGIIKEPMEIDFCVDPKPLTTEEISSISAFIQSDKQHLKDLQFHKSRVKTMNHVANNSDTTCNPVHI